MPMSRYEIRNEYSLADPEVYGGGGAGKDGDPEALLEAVAMAGLVGVLRQLGDLAQFAAEVFHDLHEEVMVTATRGHGLMVRVKQLEADFPVIEKAFLSQTSPSAFYSNPGAGWHPSLQKNQNLITGGDLPRFIMDSYEECRGPPRLFLLDKFDVAGAGACLKRYTDPSFFKVEASSYGLSSAEVQKEKRSRKSKKKSSRLRKTPEVLSASNAKLQQLFLEDRVENGITDSARLVKLKRLNRHPFGSETGKSFMEKFIGVSSPEDKVVHEVGYGSLTLELPCQTASASGTGVSYLKESTSVERTVLTPFVDEVSEDLRYREFSLGTKQYPLEVVDEKEIAVDRESKPDASEDYNQSDDVASEVDTYMDALATMEPEIETDTEFRSKTDIGSVDMENQETDCDVNEELLQVQSSDSPSTGNSNGSVDGNDSVKKGSSSFSYSDTGSTAAENVPVDIPVAAKVSPSKFCEDEVTVMSMKKHSSSEELLEAQDYQPTKIDVSDDTSDEVTNLPSHGCSGDPCSSVLIPDSVLTHIPLDDGIARGTSTGAQTVKISSNHDELDTGSIKIEENSRSRGNNIPWTSRHSSVPSETKVDEPPVRTASAENNILEKLDGDLSVLPGASIRISENILEVIPKKHDNSLYNLFVVECEEDVFTEDSIDRQISPHSVISHADIKPTSPAFLDSNTSNTVLQPEVLYSVDNVYSSAKSITVDSNITSDSCHISSVAEKKEAEWAEDFPEISIVAAFDASREKETPTSILPEAYSGETDEIASSTSLVGSEATAVMIKSDHLYSGGFRSSTGFPLPSKVADGGLVEVSSDVDDTEAAALAISLGALNPTGPESLTDEKQAEVSQLQNIIVNTIVANHDSETDKVDSIFKKTLQAEDFHRVQNPDQYGSEVYDEIRSHNYNESVKQTAEVHQETAPPDLNSVRSEIDIGDHSDIEIVSSVPVSSSQPIETPVFSSSLLYCVQSTEPISSGENNSHEHSGDTSPVLTHNFPEVSTLSKPELTLQTDQFNIEHQHVVESKPKEVSQSEQLSCSNLLGSEPCFVASKSVVPVNLQADGLAVETLYGDKASFGVSSKLDINHIDHGGIFFTSPRASSVTPTSELSQPESHEVVISAQAMDESSAVRSGSLPIPELPQVRLPEMPSLPPLPPVQWRTGRVQQHASLPSDRDSVQNNTQMVNLTNRDDFLAPVPVVPPLAIKDKDHQHAYEHLLGTTEHSSPLSMQMPLTSKNRSRDVPTTDRISNTDPCLTMLSTDNESPGHRLHAGEAGSMLSSVTPSSTVTGADASYFSGSVPSHPSSQMQPEVCLEHESTYARGEVGLKNFSDTNFPQPIVADEHFKDVCTALEGETVTSTSNSSCPAMEDGVLNGNLPMKLPRPRSPYIDAVPAYDKSTLRKVTERSRPEVQKAEERDSLLEQIRAKSKKLKPAGATRRQPSIEGPKQNLVVAAMLERKAKTIRKACAGSDEDEDRWSDEDKDTSCKTISNGSAALEDVSRIRALKSALE